MSYNPDTAEMQMLLRRRGLPSLTGLTGLTDPYDLFLASKRRQFLPSGFTLPDGEVCPLLDAWQKAVVLWALRLGKAAIFADCGLGKSPMSLEWARQVCRHTGGDVLILTTLAVAAQMAREGAKFGIPVNVCQSQKDVLPGVNVTNYDQLHNFDPTHFAGVVLDESSILKNFTGKIKQQLFAAFARAAYKLCCTATPAPNDYLELGNHAAFLDVMPANEMIMRWFINDTMAAGNYRLKKHAEKDFWLWVASWAVSLSKPSDLSPEYADDAYLLPKLNVVTHVVDAPMEGRDFTGSFPLGEKLSATKMHKEMRLTAAIRAAKVAEIIARDNEQTWVIWCNTDYEADELRSAIPDAVEVRGSDSTKVKEARLDDFAAGKIQILITKPDICGFGMNWQHCHNTVFVGLSYSYEKFYQAIRRFLRRGQTHEVNAHIVHADTEGDVLTTVQRKQRDHVAMKTAMVEAMREASAVNVFGTARNNRESLIETLPTRRETGATWDMELGDACQLIRNQPANSIHLTVTSPPFANLYIYSKHRADMGNAADYGEFFQHFRFLIRELLRVTIPGRLCAIHCKDLPAYKGRDGAAGLVDFPGEIIRAFESVRSGEEWWSFHSRVTIWKDPVIEQARTQNHGLLYCNLLSDSTQSRQGMADYMVVFRKWNNSNNFPEPVAHTKQTFPLERWQKWASPVWDDIVQTKVLNYLIAKGNSDEKHICPLQLGAIERSVALWSNPGDLVLDPFMGIGSTGYQAVKMGRRAKGFELKPEYFDHAVRNLEAAETASGQVSLMDLLAEDESEAVLA